MRFIPFLQNPEESTLPFDRLDRGSLRRAAPCFRKAQWGQGGLIIAAISILITLVVVSASLSGLSRMNASRSISTKQTLQTYYVAQAGLNEALATRMLPRTNYSNFNSDPVNQPAYFSDSGRVYRDLTSVPPNGTTLIGQYRFVVVGGQGWRDPQNGNLRTEVNQDGVPYFLLTEKMSDDSPYIVMSKGSVCKSSTSRGMVIEDQLIVGNTPTCRPGFTLDELTLVAVVRVNRGGPNGSTMIDKASSIKLYTDSTRIPLPTAAAVPGYGWLARNAQVNFDTVWNGGSVQLSRIVFYNFVDNTVDANVAVTGPLTTIPASNPIPAKDVIRLYFNTPIDYRTVSVVQTDQTAARNMKPCKDGTAAQILAGCRLRVMQNTSATGQNGTPYTGNTMIPFLPDASQMILLPPLRPSDQMGAGLQTVVVQATGMRTPNGKVGTTDYRIVFTTRQ